MAVLLSIAEYGSDAFSSINGSVNNGTLKAPPSVNQTRLSVTTSGASAAFAAATRFVRVVADTACYVAWGTAPVATVNTERIPANVEIIREVPINAGYKVAAYDGTS